MHGLCTAAEEGRGGEGMAVGGGSPLKSKGYEIKPHLASADRPLIV